MKPVPDRSKKYRGTANPDLHRAMVELRRSSATQPHKTPAEKGSRKANKKKAIEDSQNG